MAGPKPLVGRGVFRIPGMYGFTKMNEQTFQIELHTLIGYCTIDRAHALHRY